MNIFIVNHIIAIIIDLSQFSDLVDIANILIEGGADVLKPNYEKRMPLHIAAFSGNVGYIKPVLTPITV